MKCVRTATLVLLSASIVPATFVATPAALAQVAAVRNLTGDVTDKAGNKLKGAVVHLKDTRSLAQRSYITADDGVFRFGQVSTSADYEIWADLDGRKTPSKSISSFDSKKAVDVSLKMPD